MYNGGIRESDRFMSWVQKYDSGSVVSGGKITSIYCEGCKFYNDGDIDFLLCRSFF